MYEEGDTAIRDCTRYRRCYSFNHPRARDDFSPSTFFLRPPYKGTITDGGLFTLLSRIMDLATLHADFSRPLCAVAAIARHRIDSNTNTVYARGNTVVTLTDSPDGILSIIYYHEKPTRDEPISDRPHLERSASTELIDRYTTIESANLSSNPSPAIYMFRRPRHINFTVINGDKI